MSGGERKSDLEHAADRVLHASNLTFALQHIARNAEGDPVDPAGLIGLAETLLDALHDAQESLDRERRQ